jgi:hypothetical protein
MMFYDREGNAIDLMEYAAKFENRDYQCVKRDEVNGVTVSTVWLGCDHAFGHGPPRIFETMVFGGELDGEQVRYGTEAEAVAGHAEMLKRVREI